MVKSPFTFHRDYSKYPKTIYEKTNIGVYKKRYSRIYFCVNCGVITAVYKRGKWVMDRCAFCRRCDEPLNWGILKIGGLLGGVHK